MSHLLVAGVQSPLRHCSPYCFAKGSPIDSVLSSFFYVNDGSRVDDDTKHVVAGRQGSVLGADPEDSNDMAKRPEQRGPPELFYNEEEARKYTQNSRMIEIQSQMSERAVELLCLPEEQACYLLDVGCGSGLSGDYISEQGHHWVGIDISPAMLDVAVDREVEGDVLLGDMGQGIPFRPGMFDGCISISALQWLCNADKKTHSPPRRLYCFFSSLYSVLSRGSRAILQLYPENSEQLELITAQAMKAGFTGGMVVDYPNSTKAKKFFLCLFAGTSGVLPKGLGAECSEKQDSSHAVFTNQRIRFRIAKGKSVKKSKDWILEKKERRRRQGKDVRADTKFSGRKRRPHF